MAFAASPGEGPVGEQPRIPSQPCAGISIRRPAASGIGRRAWEALISASRAATSGEAGVVFFESMSTCKAMVSSVAGHPAFGRVEQLLEVMHAFGIVAKELDGDADRIVGVQFA